MEALLSMLRFFNASSKFVEAFLVPPGICSSPIVSTGPFPVQSFLRLESGSESLERSYRF